jgi:ubiquinone/menaquinone biosynthesis C-methylase UbiE
VQPNHRVLLVPILSDWPKIEAAELVGVSEDLDEIDHARALAEELGRTNCLFVVGSPEAIPWRDQYFDTAYLAAESTTEILRVMKHEGEVHECQSKF